MKILVCHNYYQITSGEDLVIENNIRIMEENGVEISRYHRNNKDIYESSFIKLARFVPQAVYSYRTISEIEKEIEYTRPDVAFVQNVFPLISPSIYYALKRRNIPIIQFVYNYRLICPNAILYTKGRICEKCINGNFLHAVWNKCFRRSYTLSALYAGILSAHKYVGHLDRQISAYITPDKFLKTKLLSGNYPGERIFTVPNPFDISEYQPSNENDGRFVFFGRIVREKGIFTLLRAAKREPSRSFDIIGQGNDEASAREYSKAAGLQNVRFLGPQYDTDLRSVLSGAAATIVPTEWYDNSPLVIFQSFAMGKPVIASNIDGIGEIVTDGEDGLLFEPGNVDDLIDKMRRLSGDEDLRKRLAVNARIKAQKRFDKKKWFAEVMKVARYAIENPIQP